MSNSTRERIVDEAMRLFSERGYSATSIATIEAAAGLSPGAGGLYHHFKSKEAVLSAGVERHLARLDALRDIRRLLAPMGDTRAELTLMARYALIELDNETELLRILAADSGGRTEILTATVERLVGATVESFARWVRDRAVKKLSAAEAKRVAAVALNSLLGSHLLRNVLGIQGPVEDGALVDTWVEMMLASIGETG